MNVRVFMLIVMTAVFGVLWSSDRQYQEAQMAAAGAARRQPVLREAVVAPRPIVAEAARSGLKARYSGNARFIVRELFGPVVERGIGGVVAWGDRMHSRVEEETCSFRWKTRRTLFFTQRHVTVLIRAEMNWLEIAIRLGRDAFRRLEVSRSAATLGNVETR